MNAAACLAGWVGLFGLPAWASSEAGGGDTPVAVLVEELLDGGSLTPLAWGEARPVRGWLRAEALTEQPPTWVTQADAGGLMLVRVSLLGSPVDRMRVEVAMRLPHLDGPDWDELVFRWFGAGERRPAEGARVVEATVGGVGVQAEHIGTVLRLRPAQPVVAGGEVRVGFVVEQAIPAIDAALPAWHGRNEEDYGLFGRWADGALSLAFAVPQPSFAADGSWDGRPLPDVGEHLRAAMFDALVVVEAPPEVRLAGSGREVACRELAGVRRCVRAAPAVRDLSFVGGPGWASVSREVAGGQTVRVVYDPAATHGWSPVAVARDTADVWSALNDGLGALPWREVEVGLVPGRSALGTELSGLLLLHPRGSRDGTTSTVAHEVAHLWWYGAVGSDQRGEPWVDEGPATWLGAWWMEATRRRSRRSELQVADVEDAVGRTGPLPPATAGADALRRGEYPMAVYLRPGVLLERLTDRQPGTMLETLRGWYDAQAGGIGTGDALRAWLVTRYGAERVDHEWSTWMEPKEEP